jgi:hypothetical protein
MERSKKRKRSEGELPVEAVESGSGPWGAPDLSQSQELVPNVTGTLPVASGEPRARHGHSGITTAGASGDECKLTTDHLATVGCGAGAMQHAREVVRDSGLLSLDEGAFEPLMRGSVEEVSHVHAVTALSLRKSLLANYLTSVCDRLELICCWCVCPLQLPWVGQHLRITPRKTHEDAREGRKWYAIFLGITGYKMVKGRRQTYCRVKVRWSGSISVVVLAW